ncbi:MAG TPA: hypothetical protein VG722_03590 [Tepidisphaeraceae bacterium]|nr:hypothetical protein [Tepidisphaeraceae bacterium]
MYSNPIVDEVHRIREQMLAEYGGDLRALMKDIQRRTEEAARAGHPIYSPPPRKATKTPPPGRPSRTPTS